MHVRACRHTQQSMRSDVIKKYFYVDDMLAGADSVKELNIMCKEVRGSLESGVFPLARASNHSIGF